MTNPKPTTTLNPGARPASGPLRTAATGAGLGGLILLLGETGRIPAEDVGLYSYVATVGGTYLGTVMRNVASMRPEGPVAFVGRMLGIVPLA